MKKTPQEMASKRKREIKTGDKLDEEGDEIVATSEASKKKPKKGKRELVDRVYVGLGKRHWYARYNEPSQTSLAVQSLYDSEMHLEVDLPREYNRNFHRNPVIFFNKACSKAVLLSSHPVVWDIEANCSLFNLNEANYFFIFNYQGTQIMCVPSSDIVDATSGAVISNIGAFSDDFSSIIFSGDGTKVLIAFRPKIENGTWKEALIESRSVVDGTTLCQFQPNHNLGYCSLTVVTCFPGSQLCAAADCVSLMIWNVDNGELVKTIPAKHGSTPKEICMCGQEDMVCVVFDTGICVWNTSNETLLWKKKDFFQMVCTVLFSSLDQAVIILSQATSELERYEQEKKVKVYDVINGGHLFTSNYSWFKEILGIGCPETESVVLL